MDKCTETNGIQTSFVIPGENPPSGALHVARTVVRRCERSMIRLAAEQEVRDTLLKFVNRLSDATYALARLEETLGKQDELRVKVEEEVRRVLNGDKLPFTLENIEKIAQRAREKATEMGVPVVFAAVDDGGNLIMMQRMKDSFMGSIDIAINKAFTANAFKMPTDVLGAASQPGQPLYGIETSNAGRIVLFGGGLFWLCGQLAPQPPPASQLALPVAFITMATGLFIIVARRKAITQVIGFLVFENGIGVFGTGMMLEHGVLVELGVLLDVMVLVFIMGIALFQISREFQHIDSDRLNQLDDSKMPVKSDITVEVEQ